MSSANHPCDRLRVLFGSVIGFPRPRCRAFAGRGRLTRGVRFGVLAKRMKQLIDTSKLRYSRGPNPRRNLPPQFSRKRGESNFLRAFEKIYFAAQTKRGVARAEFDFSGFGIADLVWLSWPLKDNPEEATAVGLQRRLRSLRVVAFELKLSEWRRGLAQAFRYSYFADLAVVVLTPRAAEAAVKHVAEFRRLSVGLWAFDRKTGMISKHFTPRRQRAKSTDARDRAVALLLRSAKLCQILEKR